MGLLCVVSMKRAELTVGGGFEDRGCCSSIMGE